MLKKLIPLLFTVLTISSCNGSQSSKSSVKSSEDDLSSIVSSVPVTSISEEPVEPSSEAETEESVVSSSEETPFDEFEGLHPDARKVAEYLKNNESRDEVSYFKVNVRHLAGGVIIATQFSYHFAEQLFVTFCTLIDQEDDVEANGYVIFEWNDFLKGYFGGNYRNGDYYIEDMQFYDMSRDDHDFKWYGAAYGKTNYPNPNENSYVIAGFDLAFMCLQEGIYYGAEFLENTFRPSLTLFRD